MGQRRTRTEGLEEEEEEDDGGGGSVLFVHRDHFPILRVSSGKRTLHSLDASRLLPPQFKTTKKNK